MNSSESLSPTDGNNQDLAVFPTASIISTLAGILAMAAAWTLLVHLRGDAADG